jgi:hypothetical protein
MPIPEIKTKKTAAAVRKCAEQIYVAVGHVREFGTPEDQAIADRLDELSNEMWKAARAAFPDW